MTTVLESIPAALQPDVAAALAWFNREQGSEFAVTALRMVRFVAAWIAARALLPTLWVGVAFALWVAWITPQVRFLDDQFQNEAAT